MTPELAKALNEMAITLIAGITTVFLPWAFKIARAYARAKIESVQNEDMRAALEFALNRLDNTAQTVVAEINQTMRPDGKLNPEEAKKILARAYGRISSRLPEDVTATLRQAYGEKLASVIVGKIEANVARSKP